MSVSVKSKGDTERLARDVERVTSALAPPVVVVPDVALVLDVAHVHPRGFPVGFKLVQVVRGSASVIEDGSVPSGLTRRDCRRSRET